MTVIIESLDALASFVGREYAVSDWIEVTEDMVRRFADLTFDHQWIHLDNDRAARETPFGGAIAHGLLTLSLVPAFMQSAQQIKGVGLIINEGFDRVRFTSPVRVGSRLRARLTLQSFEWRGSDDAEASDVRSRRHAHIKTEVCIEREGSDKPVCVAEAVVRRYPAR
ncbi:MAG: MaoC family dehydratase [Pigmentiphaga sp.]|uniref:MaoC family dehydratase n=1 Tax=Pigmentiphaga sp. TaxID=1977564 RepID=UPI0029BAD2AC|nr:MaoC family dehydratase [Pigmentiphaga sp.]MDX3906315.1 MaoC family dehydratase [Pigmentiphaga sp.]